MDAETETIGVMVCGHGSRSKTAVAEFAKLAEALRPALAPWPVAYGYLEFANPVIRDGLDELRHAGCNRILAVPGMLFAASHAKNDIPSVLNTYAARHGIKIDYGRDLGVDARMLTAAADRVRAALAAAEASGPRVPAHETCLVVVGRGASDPDANANVAKVARLLWEGFGFGWCTTAYSGVTFPLVEPALDTVAKLGFRRVVVFPYFLFSGVLIDRIYGFTETVAVRHPHVQFAKAAYLGEHPEVVATFAERVREILSGPPAMNCALCKYRQQVLGFEAEVGAPQESHHHHVEGMGAGAPGSDVASCTLCETFCTGACRLLNSVQHHHDHDHHHHGDGHHHHHYPHEDHPMGPVSVVRAGAYAFERDPHVITERSFNLIRSECDLSRFAGETAVAERVIHAAGETGIASALTFSGALSSTVRRVVAAGASVVVDSEMTRHAIARRALPSERIVCKLNDPDVAQTAQSLGHTRSMVALGFAREAIDGGVVVIGNAPTALFALIEMMREGVRPAAIIAFPVGFVGAAESKAALIAYQPDCPFLTLKGRRGGSAMAGAALNAILLS